MGKRFGIGALAVAALIAAGPASAQLSAKPAVGTAISVKSATILAFQAGDDGYGADPLGLGYSAELLTFAIAGVGVGLGIYAVQDSRDDPSSP